MSDSLTLAFEYRKKRDYQKALMYLKKACHEEKNGRACFVMAQAYYRGGWIVFKHTEQYDYYAELGASYGYAPCLALVCEHLNDVIRSNPFARVLFDIFDLEDDEKSIKTLIKCIQKDGLIEAIPILLSMDDVDDLVQDHWAEVGVEWGDAHSMYFLGDFENAAKQGHAMASRDYAKYWFKLGFCKLGAEYLLQSRNAHCIIERQMSLDCPMPLEEQFVYGRVILFDELYSKAHQDRGSSKEFIRVYNTTVTNVREAIYAFNLCCKSSLTKDTRWCISKEIWESREEPEIWQTKKENEKSWCILF